MHIGVLTELNQPAEFICTVHPIELNLLGTQRFGPVWT